MVTPRHVTIVGGGITGLVAAHRLITGPVPLQVAVLEESPRLGREAHTISIAGETIELGLEVGDDPRCVSTSHGSRSPTLDLAESLGLGPDVIHGPRPRVHILLRGSLRRVPKDLVDGVPLHLRPIAESGLISPAGLARAGLDRVRPDDWPGTDESLGALITRRLGREFATNLVEPLIGPAYAAGIWDLSAAAATPILARAARRNRSIIAGLRAASEFDTGHFDHPCPRLRRGLRSLVDRLTASLRDQDLRTGTRVLTIDSRTGGRTRYRLALDGGTTLATDGVVIALPAPRAAPLVAPRCPAAARTLAAVGYAPAATVVLALAPDPSGGSDPVPVGEAPPHSRSRVPMSGSATTEIAVPFSEGRLTTRVTVHPAADSSGPVVLRILAGHLGDDRGTQLDDDELVDAVAGELSEILGFEGRIRQWHVNRRYEEFPHLSPGHRARLGRILAEVRSNMPGVEPASLAFEGTGLSAHISRGVSAADSLIDRLRVP